MANPLGPSWKPKVAAIATPVVPLLLWCLLTNVCKLSDTTATEISGVVLATLASYGFYNAKQSDVTNSPIPLVVAQPVALAPVIAHSPPAEAHLPVVVVPNPVVETPHLI